MTEHGRDLGGRASGLDGLFAPKGGATASGFSDQSPGTIERAIEAISASATVIHGTESRPEPPAAAFYAAPAPETTEPAPVIADPARPTLLVVEDDPLNSKVLAEVLGHRGYRVVTASTGIEAVKLAASHRPDVVLLDLRLPGTSGLDIARQFKSDPALTGTRVIALTAYAREWSRSAVAAAGCDGFLAKPVPLAELESAIMTVLATAPVSGDGRAAVS